MKYFLLFLLTAFFMFGCVVDQGKVAVDIKRKIKEATSPSSLASANVSNVQIINNQLVITGSGLNSITAVKVDGNSLNQNFTIETKSATQIIANAVNAFSFDVSKVFNLIISDASASATFPIDFSLCNATLNGKAFNCSITASDKDVLSYDAVSGKWKPRSINGLSYQGTWNANDPEPSGASSGDYYIVSVASAPYAVGDWIVWNGSAYDKINNSTTITSVFGRSGAIVATKGDYDLNKLTDVDLTVPATIGQVLKFDGSKWVAGSDLSGGGAGSVTTAELANAAVTDAKIDTVSASKITGTITSTQILDGTIVNADINAAAAIDYSKLNVPAGSIAYAKLNIANGDIPAAKISGLTAATSVLATTIVDGDSTHAPDGNAVFDALGLKLNTTGGTLSVGTITGVPTPVNPSDVASKSYVDSTVAAATPSLDTDDVTEATNLYFTEPRVRSTVLTGLTTGVAGPIAATDSVIGAIGKLQYQVTDLKSYGQWTKSGSDISYSAGNVEVDKNLLFKDSGTNFVELKAPATVTSSYTLILPTTAGSANQVLQTSGATGVLTWATMSDSSVQAFAKTALPTCAAGEVLKSNGTSFSCVTDLTGAGSFTGTASRAVATDGSGALTSATTTATELGYVSGVTSAIQTQLNAKEEAIAAGTAAQYYKGDKTWATLNTTAVPEGTNLYFTTARAKAATVTDAIADAVTDVAPSQNAVFDALALKLDKTGGTLTVGTITGVPTPTNPSDVASKSYVDSAVAAATPALDTDDVTEASNLYFTQARAVASPLTGLNTGVSGPITATDTILGSLGKLQYQVTDLKSYGQWTKSGSDILYSAGDIEVDKNLKLKDSTTNFVLLKAPSAVTTYTLTMPAAKATAAGQALTSDTSGVLSWTTIADSSVQAFAKATLPTCSTGQVLKSDGTSFSCVTDNAGAAAFSGTASRAIASDASGNLTVSATTSTELGYVSGVTSSIQTQLNGKQASDATLTSLAAFNTNGILVQTAADTFTGRTIAGTSNRLTVTNGDGVAGNPTINIPTALLPSPVVADIGKFLKATAADTSVWTALGLSDITTALGYTPVNKAGDTISSGTIVFNGTGILTVPTPVSLTDAVNKQYVDTQVSTGANQWAQASGNVSRSTGNVNIGTASPTSLATYKTEISGADPLLGLSGNTNGVGQLVGLEFNQMTTSSPATRPGGAIKSIASGTYTGGTGSTYNSDLALYTGAAGTNTERLRILSNGNVGVGTTAPSNKMEVVDTDKGTQLWVRNLSSTADRFPGVIAQNFTNTGTGFPAFNVVNSRGTSASPTPMQSGDNLGSIAASGNYNTTPSYTNAALINFYASGNYSATSTPASIAFATTPVSSTTAVERMRIDSNGKVGIGIPIPAQTLDVSGSSVVGITAQTNISAFTGSGIRLDGNIANSSQDAIMFQAGGGGGAGIAFKRGASYDTYLDFYTNAASTGGAIKQAMTIDNNGWVGIGVAAPLAVLHSKNAGLVGGNPATSGTADASVLQRIEANTGVLDIGMQSSGSVWMQPRDRTNLATNFNLLLNQNGGGVTIGNPSSGVVGALTIDGTGMGGNDSPIYATTTSTSDAFSVLPYNGITYLGSGVYYKDATWVHKGNGATNALFAFGGASGGTWYASNNSAGSWNVAAGVQLWTQAGVLVGASSRAWKENFTLLPKDDILKKINKLNITRWNYIKEGKDITHIGPIAEDWNEQFKTGEDNKHIALIDEAGVALAGVQGLSQVQDKHQSWLEKLEEKFMQIVSWMKETDEKIAKLERENAELKKQNDLILKRLDSLEKRAPASNRDQ